MTHGSPRAWPPDAPFDPVEHARALRQRAEEMPKSLKWRLRSKVGDRVRRYQLPEEVTAPLTGLALRAGPGASTIRAGEADPC